MMTNQDPDPSVGRAIQLIDMVFPGDANHHGTLFGGIALAHMDKVASWRRRGTAVRLSSLPRPRRSTSPRPRSQAKW